MKGGESYKQTIRANLSDETVVLNFDSYDGSSTTLGIDFRNVSVRVCCEQFCSEIQVVRHVRLGDQDESDLVSSVDEYDGVKKGRRDSYNSYAVYKSYCFVTKFKANEFIPVDAMAKLRQKNPWSLRTPERTEPSQNVSFDILLDPTACDWISPMIRAYCASNDSLVTTTYAIKMEVSERAVNPEEYLRAVRDVSAENWAIAGERRALRLQHAHLHSLLMGCFCLGWYPCALKFCRARSGAVNGTVSANNSPAADNLKTYRCGIHTCRVCRNYLFGVTDRNECV
ncbi:Out at first protein [Orchesella cincta]|uniref:Out at first protein n=1 Tax=Orchesella cincta TaxID=48709 RepID=A0A1D2MIK1_ORCCI|nr:Out at first protein [Orchesella cincta]